VARGGTSYEKLGGQTNFAAAPSAPHYSSLPPPALAKTYSRPLVSKSGGAFALHALQLVPPLVGAPPYSAWELGPNSQKFLRIS